MFGDNADRMFQSIRESTTNQNILSRAKLTDFQVSFSSGVYSSDESFDDSTYFDHFHYIPSKILLHRPQLL